MKKITKIDPKQVRSVATFVTDCGCYTCNDCNSTSSQAIALGVGAQANIADHPASTEK